VYLSTLSTLEEPSVNIWSVVLEPIARHSRYSLSGEKAADSLVIGHGTEDLKCSPRPPNEGDSVHALIVAVWRGVAKVSRNFNLRRSSKRTSIYVAMYSLHRTETGRLYHHSGMMGMNSISTARVNVPIPPTSTGNCGKRIR